CESRDIPRSWACSPRRRPAGQRAREAERRPMWSAWGTSLSRTSRISEEPSLDDFVRRRESLKRTLPQSLIGAGRWGGLRTRRGKRLDEPRRAPLRYGRGYGSMNERHERLPEERDRILANGGRLQVTVSDRGEIRIEGNRTGLRALAAICDGLASLKPEELQ